MNDREWMVCWKQMKIIYRDESEGSADVERMKAYRRYFEIFTYADMMTAIDEITKTVQGFGRIPDVALILPAAKRAKERRTLAEQSKRDRQERVGMPSEDIQARRFEFICKTVAVALIKIPYSGSIRSMQDYIAAPADNGDSLLDLLMQAQQYDHPCNETPGAFVALWEPFPEVQQALAERLTASEVA